MINQELSLSKSKNVPSQSNENENENENESDSESFESKESENTNKEDIRKISGDRIISSDSPIKKIYFNLEKEVYQKN